jgi:diaminopimelate epimerase
MKLTFTKMHGLGNDFIVLDGVRQTISLDAAQIKQLANRHFGIGFDQLLLVEPARSSGADFRYRIFNADGDEVEQCGNGARCFAHFVHDQQLSDKNSLVVETNTGIIELNRQADGMVTVDMGRPQLEPEHIPFLASRRATCYAIEVDGRQWQIAAVSMGNPHAVLQVDNVDTAPVNHLGPLLERHERFPNGVNVGFMQLIDRHHITLRVFERGVGETLACGSGACAAVVAGRIQGLLDSAVKVDLVGGGLHIVWAHVDTTVVMTGPANRVFTGEIEL